jgi:O-succinylbenzoate synthase
MSTEAVRVDGIEIREVVLPMRRPHHAATSHLGERRLLLVRLGGGGAEGWGECGPIPGYSDETFSEARLGMLAAAPGLLGVSLDWASDHLASSAPPSVLFALESARFDLLGASSGLPVWRRIGGANRDVEVGAVVGVDPDPASLVRKVGDLASAGYCRVKVKVGALGDLPALFAVRQSLPSLDLAIDANGSFTADELPVLAGLDQLGLSFIEQPFPRGDLATSARLAAILSTPVCLDEEITGLAAAEAALGAGAGSVLVIKPARLGGFEQSARVISLAASRGAGTWVGGMLESGIGRSAALAVATLPGITHPADLAPPSLYLSHDLLAQPLQMAGGSIALSDRPGLGFQVDAGALAGVTVAAARFGAQLPPVGTGRQT